MSLRTSKHLTFLLLCSALFGQSVTPAAQPQTFHIRGTITDPLDAVIRGVKVTFRGGGLSSTVTTDDVGVYEADLPLGSYTMTATANGFRMYRRPLFRMASRARLTINVSLPVAKYINITERPATAFESKAAASASTIELPYYGEELFSVPSSDGVPYELLVRYTKGERTRHRHDYRSEKTPYDDPIFVAYNLFSLQADRVTYDEKSHIIEASGHVVAADGSGADRRADTMSFKIEDGQATPLR